MAPCSTTASAGAGSSPGWPGCSPARWRWWPARVTVKMLPFDNKSEFQVLLDMPPGTPLEGTLAAAERITERLADEPEVRTSSSTPASRAGELQRPGAPLRPAPRPAFGRIHVRLTEAATGATRATLSPAGAPLVEAPRAYGARVKVVEVPPGRPCSHAGGGGVRPDLDGQRTSPRRVGRVPAHPGWWTPTCSSPRGSRGAAWWWIATALRWLEWPRPR